MANETISELLPAFERYLRSSTNLAPRSQKIYVSEMRLFGESLGDPYLSDLTPQALVDWHTECVDQGLRYSTLAGKKQSLRQFLVWLDEVQEEPQGTRLLRALRRIKPPLESRQTVRQPFALSDALVHKMLTAAKRGQTGGRDGPMLHFLWDTGIRRQELVDLRLEDLDLENRRARVIGKGSKERTVRFTQACKQDLEAWLKLRALRRDPGDTLFISLRGGALHPDSLNLLFKKWAKKARIREEVWPHLMRHTRITAAVNSMGLHNAARLAGHSNVNTTQGYFHEDPEDMDRAYDKMMGEDTTEP